MEAGRLQIGPLEWMLHVPEGVRVSYSDPAYCGFWHENARDRLSRPLMSAEVRIQPEARAVPAGEPLYLGGKNWALWDQGAEIVICAGFTGRSTARLYCRLQRDGRVAEVFADPGEGSAAICEAPLRYPLDQILSWGLLAECGGVILHSAVAVFDGKGWIFSGRSGAGKSTLSGLCHQAGWRILNDDRVMVFPRDGQIRVAGTPWHGSGRFAEAAELPLGGIFFLDKAAENRIERLSPEAARYALLDVAAVPWFEDRWSQRALDAAEALLQSVPCHRFGFNKTPAAVEMLTRWCVQSEEVPA